MPVKNNIDKRNKNIKIYINGSFYDRDDAKISVFDSGYLLGDGIWEGIRLVNNNWMFLDEHLNRLFEGCKAIDIKLNLSKDDIKQAIADTQLINDMTDSAHARVMITRGNKIKPFQQPNLSDGINFVIIMEHSEENPNKEGISLITVPQVRGLPMSQDPKLNSHSKLNCILACIEANKKNADEALMFDINGNIATNNSTHFFFVKDNTVFTSTGKYCVTGITRKKIIELCKKNKIKVKEKNFKLKEVLNADEAFVTGSFAIGIISGAYSTEVFRGAIQSIDKGQFEASKVLGLKKPVHFFKVIMPQMLRLAIPNLSNVWQITLKDTSLISVTGLVEIMRQSYIAAGSTRDPLFFYSFAAVLYLLLTFLSMKLINKLETKYRRGY